MKNASSHTEIHKEEKRTGRGEGSKGKGRRKEEMGKKNREVWGRAFLRKQGLSLVDYQESLSLQTASLSEAG